MNTCKMICSNHAGKVALNPFCTSGGGIRVHCTGATSFQKLPKLWCVRMKKEIWELFNGIENRVCTSYYTLMFGKRLTIFTLNPDSNSLPEIESGDKEDSANAFCMWIQPVTSQGELVCQENNNLKFVLKTLL